jgi:hypothetical protein
MKGVHQARMKRSIIKAILKMCMEAVLFTAIIGVGIGMIGYVRNWNSSIAYSDAFFLAGCMVIVAGGLSRLGAGQEWSIFQLFSAESFRDMSSGERAKFIVSASSPIRLVLLGALTGILLILISAIAAYMS